MLNDQLLVSFAECILSFLRLHSSTVFWTLLLTMIAPPFLLRDSCPQQEISWSSELNSPISVHFSSLTPKMLTFTLVISCLTTSNLPSLMDLTFQFLCNIVLYSIGLNSHHWSHLQLGVVFALALSLYSFWSYFSSLLQQHIGHLPTWGVHLSVSYLFVSSYCSYQPDMMMLIL